MKSRHKVSDFILSRGKTRDRRILGSEAQRSGETTTDGWQRHSRNPSVGRLSIAPLRFAYQNPFITAVRPTAECPLARFFLWPKDRRLLWKGIFYSLTFAPLTNFFNVSACHRLWNKDSFLSNLCSRPKAERRSGTNIRN